MLVLYTTYIEEKQEKLKFEQLYYAYRKQMMSVAMAVVYSQTDAEDISFCNGNTSAAGGDIIKPILICHQETIGTRKKEAATTVRGGGIMSMTREELNQAFREAMSLEFVDIPCREETIMLTFSDRFKRVAMIAVVCLSLFVTACSTEAFREPILQKIEKFSRRVTSHILDGHVKSFILHTYQLTVLPDGAKLIDKSSSFRYRDKIYKDENDNQIRFSQYAAENPYIIMMNTWLEQYTLEIRGLEVEIYEYSDCIIGVWVEDGYVMELIYDGCTDVEVLEEMIEGIE